jgi:predicted nucleotidyltransferase
VRFIYSRPVKDYLKLQELRDVIELPINDELDINGWDLQKTLRLLHKSNPTLFEWGNSPIIYKDTENWQKVKAVMNKYFVTKPGMWHYLSMAERNYREFLRDREQIKLKKYFYVLRPVLACKWILDENSPPPMLYTDLVKAKLSKEMLPYIDRLLDLKMNSAETKFIPPVPEIHRYIEESFAQLRNALENMPKQQLLDFEELNGIFLEILGA